MKIILTALCLAMAASLTCLAADPPTRPNILFIITDQQFAEVMSCRMGSEFIRTPAMDGLAKTGRLFTRAYSSNPLCMPFRNSVFSGRFPHETGVTRNQSPEGGFDAKKYPCMGTYFRDGGYDAAYCGKWHLFYHPKLSGFEMLTGKKEKGNPDVTAADAAAKFLARPHDKPFLLVASFVNPHNICEYSRRLAGRNQALTCGEIGEPPSLDHLPPAPTNIAPPKDEPDGMTMMRRGYQVENGLFPVGKFTADDWRKHRWAYYRMTELVDKEIGRVLAALRESGLDRNTVIVFTADHGECAGAHGFNQKTVFYDESARVPLIVTCGKEGSIGTSDKLVNTGIDLLPTMLDFAGIDIPKTLPGRSLKPLVVGTTVDWRDHVVVENHMSQAGLVDGFVPRMEGRMVRTEKFKYCVYGCGDRRESLVNMEADPGETVNLAGDPQYRDVLLKHRGLLARFGKEHNDTLVDTLLADNVKPIAFPKELPAHPAEKSKKEK